MWIFFNLKGERLEFPWGNWLFRYEFIYFLSITGDILILIDKTQNLGLNKHTWDWTMGRMRSWNQSSPTNRVRMSPKAMIKFSVSTAALTGPLLGFKFPPLENFHELRKNYAKMKINDKTQNQKTIKKTSMVKKVWENWNK